MLMQSRYLNGYFTRTARTVFLLRIVENEARLRRCLRKVYGHAVKQQAAFRRQEQLEAADLDDRVALPRRRLHAEFRSEAGASAGRH